MSKFSNIFKVHPRARQTQPNLEHRLFQPSRDWFIGLVLFFVVVISGSIVSALLFLRYSEISITPTETTTALPRYNQQVVSEVLSVYQNRADTYQALKAGIRFVPVTVIEPVAEVATSTATTTATVEGESTEEVDGAVEVRE
jgi:hypothetical protein